MSNIAGIDPGLNGAVAILNADGQVIHAEPLRTIEHGKGQLVDARHLADVLRTHAVVHSVIENVATRPGQGIVSNGQFMRATGTVYGVAALQGSTGWVTPPVWKRFHDLLGKSKEDSRKLALSLFDPTSAVFFTPRRKHLTKRAAQDMADAALIARWYTKTGGRTVSQLRRLGLQHLIPGTLEKV